MIKIEEGKHYTTSEWAPGIPNYECTKCQFAHLDKEAMQRHWDKSEKHKHVWARPAQAQEV